MTAEQTQDAVDKLLQQIKDARDLFSWAMEHAAIDSQEDAFNWIAQIAHGALRCVDPTLPVVDPTRPRPEFVNVYDDIAG